VRTKSGKVLTDEELDRLAGRAEGGLDLKAWQPRRGRPSLGGTAERSPRIAVRVPRALHRRVADRAASEGKSVSEIVRDLLGAYASSPPK
jgi:predicted HicB family RNase H-like nuclease